MRRKSDLPSKPCRTCGRPFTWRRKWREVVHSAFLRFLFIQHGQSLSISTYTGSSGDQCSFTLRFSLNGFGFVALKYQPNIGTLGYIAANGY